MRRPQGVFNYGGVRRLISAENRGRGQRQGSGSFESDLARRGAAERFAHSAEPRYLRLWVGKLLGCVCMCALFRSFVFVSVC